jgi:hypothetical protein
VFAKYTMKDAVRILPKNLPSDAFKIKSGAVKTAPLH